MVLLWEQIQLHYHRLGGKITIKIYLEYKCYRVWIYNSHGELIDNDLPISMQKYKKIDNFFWEIQNIYDSLFIDDGYEFKYVGFSTDEQKKLFFKKTYNAVEQLRKKLENDVKLEIDLSQL